VDQAVTLGVPGFSIPLPIAPWHMKCDCRRDLEFWLDRLPKLQAGRQPSRSACRRRAAEPPRVAFAMLLVLERFNRAFRLHYLSGGSAMRASTQPKFTPMPAGQMKSASRSGFGKTVWPETISPHSLSLLSLQSGPE